MDRPAPQLHLKQRREQTIELLCQGFARDRLELQEFENRLDLANRAATLDQLAALVADLPSPDAAPGGGAARPVREAVARGSRALGEAVRDSRTLLAFMGGLERRGHWTPARRNFVIGVMGGVELDFRDVELPAGVTEVQVFCFMGGADIIVPPGLAVDGSGTAIMGGFAHASAPRTSLPDAPVLRITGVCVMGGVDIQVRQPGESAREARVRQREEQRALRRSGTRRPPGAG